MSIAEFLLTILILIVLASFAISSLQFPHNPFEPYILKARVFSELKKLRRTGIFYELKLDANGISVFRGDGLRYSLDPDVDISFVNTGNVSYTSKGIERSGTVYGKGWSLSFQPVTGAMRIEVK